MKQTITTMQKASTTILAKIIQDKGNSKRNSFMLNFKKEIFKRKK